ncbi:MAG: hypothetical protein IPH36_09420 [Saprospiraceae bacterium]|nr:hypothetical protein [Saprospiraceae bacterium]
MVLLTQSLKELKRDHVELAGIVRTDVRLKRALDHLSALRRNRRNLTTHRYFTPAGCELRNLITIAYLITKAAQIWESQGPSLQYRLSRGV